MRTERPMFDDRTNRRSPGLGRNVDNDRGAGLLKCGICRGPLANHEIGDHATKVAERMLRIGFPTPVNGEFP